MDTKNIGNVRPVQEVTGNPAQPRGSASGGRRRPPADQTSAGSGTASPAVVSGAAAYALRLRLLR